DRCPDLDVVEQPLGLRDVHPDAAVRDGVPDRTVRGRAVKADTRGRQPHPARAEWIAGPRRNRLLPLRPRRVRRVPPWVLPLDDDREAAERRRILMLAGCNREEAAIMRPLIEEELVRAAADHDHWTEVRTRQLRTDRFLCERDRCP